MPRTGFASLRNHLIPALLIGAVSFGVPALAVEDHSGYFEGPLNSGPEVTNACLKCHEDAATQVMATSHWTWSALQEVGGKTVNRGKLNAINNFCLSIEGNWPRCTSCHVGYGWQDASFDFSDRTKVDCLVCHDTTGDYKKPPTAAGMPDPVLDLLNIARNVGPTSRQTCGNCHFFGGGGDGIKHGDLDSSLFKGSRTLDVHMGTDGADFSCQECHKTDSHAIGGSAMVASPANPSHIGCTGCHDEQPHTESLINRHMDRVACQTCHIPAFAKELPTKTSWDWSTAGQDHPVEKDEYGKQLYAKKKGNFTWGKNITPTYAWYNGKGGVYTLGDAMDPTQVTALNYPLGDQADPTAKIFPFKTHTGQQPYDTMNNYFTTVHLFGKDGYWATFNWKTSIETAMQSSGVPFSGEYGFARTIMYWPINHMVTPKDQALDCLDCHGDSGRLDWPALGYDGDPMRRKIADRM